MFGIEASYFIKFHNHGEILGFYDLEPVQVSSPSLVVFIGSVQDFSKQENNKIKFLFKNNEEIDYQFDKDDDIDNWLEAFYFFQNKFQNPPFGIEKWGDIDWTTLAFSNVDEEIKWKIIRENEIKFFEKIEKNFDHNDFIHDKGLDDIFSYNPMDLIKNRVLLSKGGFKEQEIKTEFDPNFDENDEQVLDNLEPFKVPTIVPKQTTTTKITNISNITNMMGDFITKYDKYFMLVSNIPIANIDQNYFEEDQDELVQEDMHMHHEMELYCIYIFEYMGKGDYKGSTNYIEMESLEYAYIDGSFMGGYKLCLGTSKKEFTLTFTTVMEAMFWLEGIRRCMEIAKRSGKVGMQKFIQTVKLIYTHLSKGDKLKIKEELDNILIDHYNKIEKARLRFLDPLEKNEDLVNPFKKIKSTIQESIMEMEYFYDAFVNHTVFNDQLFKYISFRFAGTMRYFYACYWMTLISKLGSLTESMEFISLLNLYLDFLEKWKLSDPVLENCKRDVCFTISNQAFHSSKGTITNLITSVFQPAEQTKGKYQTMFLVQLFGHFSFLCNTCLKLGDNFSEVREFLLDILYRLICLTMTEILTRIKTKELDIEQSMMICQTNGMDEFRKFISTFCGYSRMTSKAVRKGLNEDYYDRCIIKVESFGFENFTKILEINFEAMLEVYAQNFFLFNVSVFLNDFISEYEDLIKSADQDEQENIMTHLIHIFQKKYFITLCDQSLTIKKKNADSLYDRVQADGDVIKAFFKVYVEEDMILIQKLFDELELFLRSDDYENLMVCLLNFQSLFPNIFNLERLDQLLAMKVFFDSSVLKKIRSEFEKFFENKSLKTKVEANLAVVVKVSSPVIYRFVHIMKNISKVQHAHREFIKQKKEAFSYMYEPDAYNQMMTYEINGVRQTFSGINVSMSANVIPKNMQDSMKEVKTGEDLQNELLKKWSAQVFYLDKFILPAVANWGLVDESFMTLKREIPEQNGVYLRFDKEVIKVSSDFFGQNRIAVFNYRVMDNLRKIDSNGFCFTVGQKCIAFFTIKEKERKRTTIDDSDMFIDVIQKRIDAFEKDVYEGVNLHRLNPLNLSEKLGSFDLEIEDLPLIYDYDEEIEKALEKGQLKIDKSRKKSVEFAGDLI